MTALPQIGMAVWLTAVILVPATLLPMRRPFVFALDRSGQARVLVAMIGGGIAETLTLWSGGFWG